MSLLLRAAIIGLLASTAVATTPDHPLATSPPYHDIHRSLADAPSVRLHILLKGKNMHVHGQSVFDVFAKPVVSTRATSVRYDGFATFIQGDSRFTYMVADGAGCVVESLGDDATSVAAQTTRCLSSITPFDSIVAALNNLTVASSESVDDDIEIDCASGTLFETTFGGEDFVVCASGTKGFIAYGGDITMAVEYLDRPLRSISAPKLSDSNSACEVVAGATTVTPNTIALLTGLVL